jgi:hypothetical protein
MLKPEHLAKATDRIVGAARAMLAAPNDMAVRAGYVRATFNHDITAQVIATLAGDAETITPQRGEPLPCPFCGGEAEIINIERGENAGGSCVSCARCLASSNVEFGFKENFVANWNRRVPAKWRPTHRHLKRGTEYQVIGQGMVQVGEGGLIDGEAVVIYRDETGRWWVRPPSEFDDGRFVPLAPEDTTLSGRPGNTAEDGQLRDEQNHSPTDLAGVREAIAQAISSDEGGKR